jgi:hypothetical protein
VLVPDRSSAATARWAVDAAARRWGFRRSFDLASVVGELVANAVVHTESRVVAVRCSMVAPGCVEVAVTDDSGVAPAVESLDLEALGGRGVRLVDAISDAWGWRPIAEGGKVVWARLVDQGHGSVTESPSREVVPRVDREL